MNISVSIYFKAGLLIVLYVRTMKLA